MDTLVNTALSAKEQFLFVEVHLVGGSSSTCPFLENNGSRLQYYSEIKHQHGLCSFCIISNKIIAKFVCHSFQGVTDRV